jgi:succinylglutamate desuccinylase
MASITLEDGSTQALPSAQRVGDTNCGTPGVWRFDSGQPGPHIAVTALVHGNEVCGADALWRVVQSPPSLARGRLTLVFCNLEAYAQIDDDARREECRYRDEDMNRVWGRLEVPAETYEWRRAREILPFVEDADVLLDLHSMSEPAPALGLVGLADKNIGFARRIGYPALLVRDKGHAAGLRLIDREPFGDAGASPVAMLVECGQHFSRAAFDAAAEATRRTIGACLGARAPGPASSQQVIEVTEAVTIETDRFEVVGHWANMSCVAKAGTLVARDGGREVLTPYDDAWMVMPATARYRKPGLTAVRFGRTVSARPA